MGEDETLRDVLSFCEVTLDGSMGIAEALWRVIEAQDLETVQRYARQARLRLRNVHAVWEYNIARLGNRQAGAQAMLPDFAWQKVLKL